MRKLFRKLHLWLSIPAGVIIVIMCLTGAILVFQEEILRMAYPERYSVSDTSHSPLALSEIIDRVDAELVDDKIVSIQIPDKPNATYVATLESGARSHVYIDPYTSEIKGYYNYRSGFFFQTMRLHRWMMLKDLSTGRLITGGATILFVIILISGIVVWFPRKGLPKKSHFTIKWNGSFSRKTFDLHRVIGFYVCLGLLLLSLTGLMWSFDWYRGGVGTLFGVEQPAKGGKSAKNQSQEKPEVNHIDWDEALTIAQANITDYKYILITEDGNVSVLQKKAPHPRATDGYKLNDGQLKLTSKYSDRKDSRHLMTWAYALHVGNWGGIWSKILVFVISLSGITLPITGYMLWIRGMRRKNNSRNNIASK